MRYIYILTLAILFSFCSQPENTVDIEPTVFETSNGLESATYSEALDWWRDLAQSSKSVTIEEFGETDAGEPLHLVVLSNDNISIADIASSNKCVMLINNAIHPGEPDGVDASMLLYRDVLSNEQHLLDSTILVCIPFYNIGGALNRNSHSRTNQLGPKEYGFRGNAQNLDLNRDFVKCDSRNAKSFAQLLQLLDPDMYIETHVSNGADYQYALTYLSTQPNKLGYVMGDYLSTTMIPSLESKMSARDQDMVPYVNIHGKPLEDSYKTFYDSPRYSSGLTTLHHIYGFITETHMLKPFKNRVEATYDYLLSSVEFCYENNHEIQKSRTEQAKFISEEVELHNDWEVDTSNTRQLLFKGYEFGFKNSTVSQQPRLYYDTSKPVTKNVQFVQGMKPISTIQKPSYYFLRKGFTDVEDRLRWNGVSLVALEKDTLIEVESFVIENYETVSNPYEKHYLHYNANYHLDTLKWQFRKGDFVIKMGSHKDRFILEVLEPNGPDSYFNWNFFDATLQQKEWYSAYVFEDKAAQYLEEDEELKNRLEIKKSQEPNFASNQQAQLYWVYRNSQHYEKEHMRLPVFRK